MSELHPLPPPEPTYRAIEATLASHEPGRRFLAEHARRSRHAETAGLLDAVARLHARAAEATPPPAAPADLLAADLPALRALATAAGESLAAAADPGGPDPPGVGDDDVVGLMERVQDAVWTMREGGSDARLCDLLDGLTAGLRRAWQRRDGAVERAREAVGRLGDRLAQVDPRPDGPDTGTRGRRRRTRREPSGDARR